MKDSAAFADTVIAHSLVIVTSLLAAAALLSVAQAWAAAPSRYGALRHVSAVLVTTPAVTLSLLLAMGFHKEIPEAHRNVFWSAVALGPLTTVAVFVLGSRLHRTLYTPYSTLSQRTGACLPTTIGLVAVVGFADLFILAWVFMGNIH